MELITDVARGDWLLARVGSFASVGGVAGTGFEAYARILHPVPARHEDRTVIDEWNDHPVLEERLWRWADVAVRTGGTMHPQVQWTRLTGIVDESDLSFEDGWRVGPPEDGSFDPAQLAALTGHFAAATTTPGALVAGIWDGWGDINGSSTLAIGWQGPAAPTAAESAAMHEWAVEHTAAHRLDQEARRASIAGPRLEWPGRAFVLFAMTLSQLADPTWVGHAHLGLIPVQHTPQLLWPEDHAWVVATEIDWDSTIVAGSRALVDAVLADDRLEAFEVDEDSDLTRGGDTVNRRGATG